MPLRLLAALLLLLPGLLLAQNNNDFYPSQNGGFQNNGNFQNGQGGSQQQTGPGPARPPSYIQQNAFNAVNYTAGNTTGVPAGAGVTLQLQLQSYSNPSFRLPDGRTCVCPQTNGCTYMSKANPAQCLLSFTFVIASPDATVQYIASDFQTLDSQGSIQRGNVNSNFGQPYSLNLASKPSSVDIFVHHLGAVIAQDGSLVDMQTLAHVDTFVLPLDTPSVSGQPSNGNTKTLAGTLVSDSLVLTYTVTCSGTLVGPNCDLSCNRSTVNSNVAICVSMTTGYYSICQYSSGGQVSQCNACPWGIGENSYCRGEDGGVLDPHTAGVTDKSFKTATIILGVLCGVLLILFLLLCIIICIARNAKNREEQPPGYNARAASRSHEGAAQRPLLQSAPTQLVQPQHPQPPPRTNPPPLTAQPTKSALRKPHLVPPAHQGGSNSVNDTLNTSFASSEVPMRPSRSEVV